MTRLLILFVSMLLAGITIIGLSAGTHDVSAQSCSCSGTTGRIPKFTGSMILGDSVMLERNNRIGFGTGNPQEALDVIGGAFFRGSSTRANFAVNQNGTGEVARFLKSGVNVMTIANDGNVGIGTTSPQARLHVIRGDAGPEAADQQQPLGPNGGTSQNHWQSFTAGVSGLLSRVTVHMRTGNSGLSVTMTHYLGEGTAGQVLASSQQVDLGAFFDGQVSFAFPGPALVAVGAQYTWATTTAFIGGVNVAGDLNSNPYPGGRANLGPNMDWEFATFVQSVATPLVVSDGTSPDAYCDGNTWVNASSRDAKEDVSPLTSSDYESLIPLLEKTDVVHYRYKGDCVNEIRLGLIADDVPDVLADASRKGISTADAIGFLTGIVKQQQKEILALKIQATRMDVLERELAKLRDTTRIPSLR